MEKTEKKQNAAEFALTVGESVLTMMLYFPFSSSEENRYIGKSHTHSVYELFYATEGSFVLHAENEEHTVKAGEILLVAPSLVHYVTSEENTQQYVLKFSVADLHGNKDHKSFEVLSFRGHRILTASVDTASLIPMIDKALLDGQSRAAVSLLYALLSMLSKESEDSRPDLSVLADNKAKRVYVLEEFLNRYYDSACTLESLAEKLHLSERQLSRIVKKEYGETFRSRLSSIRVEAAKRLLFEGHSIAAVAEAVGYSSLSAFYSAYKRHYGDPPGKMKK